MKSFLERSPYVIGTIALIVIVLGTGGAILLDGGFLSSTYRVEAEFVDGAGLRANDSVLIAGVKSGVVAEVGQSASGDTIIVQIDLNSGVELPRNTVAEIRVDTVLGSKSLALALPDDPDWSIQLKDADPIPVERTKTPFESIDLQDVGTDLAVETDADALNLLIGSLSEITDGTRDDVTAIITNLNDLTTAVNDRETEARDLLDAAAEVTTTLADRDTELLKLIDELSIVVRNLDDQKDELVRLLEETAASSQSLNSLLGDHRADLDAIFLDLDATLAVIDERQLDLAAGLAYSASAIEGFSGIGYSGPNRTPHPWANIFLGSAGPAGIDPLLGGCGVLDIALDVLLGPDPVPCADRDGPVGAADAGSATIFRSGDPDDRSAAPLINRVLEMAGGAS